MKSGAVITQEKLVSDLKHLGLLQGDTVMVHSSLKKIGYVVGGPETVITSILDVIDKDGTLIMPAFSPAVSDPETWENSNFRDDDIQIIRDNLPVFDKTITATNMGIIPETFRNWPDVQRSDHPQISVTALGPHASHVTKAHPFEWGQGADSSFERIYEMDAKLLLLGVWTNRATVLHYAESLVPHGRRKTRSFPIIENGIRRWVNVPEIGDDLDTHFPAIGDSYFSQDNGGKIGQVGMAKSALASTKELVDFGRKYLADVLPV